MAQANTEQKRAIEHSGGVLLKAGAGSGKTFVLNKHMLYLTENWIRDFQSTGSTEVFDSYIKSKFSKVVLMTFTKKAAGEISIRLVREFTIAFHEASDQDKRYWEIALEQLDNLTVTTIHGFCFKLIKQGFFPEIDMDEEVVSEAQLNETLKNIFNRWLDTQLESEDDRDFVDLVIKDREAIFTSIKSIFGDPTIRKMWKDLTEDQWQQKFADESIIDLMEVLGITKELEPSVDLLSLDKYTGKPWFEFLKSFEGEKRVIQSLDDLLAVNKFFLNIDYKMPATPSVKTLDPSVKQYYVGIKNLKDFLKANGQDFVKYQEHSKGLVKQWFSKFKSIFDYVDFHYTSSVGITFSDLEYIVATGLQNEQIAQTISESYNYLIVDEFQDTSQIQFEIIKKIIKNDFSRLFCVGDIKQAIYGFRGGELGVFLNCESLVPRVLSLKNNYRSDQEIIHFNNNLFDYLFGKGLKFQGQDIKPVEVEYQNVPDDSRALGQVYQLAVDVEFLHGHGLSAVSSNEIDYLEALGLLEQIKNIKNLQNEDSIAILYKKLKPSLLLIGLLIENQIGFTAQVKIPYAQDPLLGIFKILLERDFNTNQTRAEYARLVIKSYLSLIDNKIQVDLASAIDRFDSMKDFYGLYMAFYVFVQNLGLANSNYKNNLLQIKTLCLIGAGDLEYILSLLKADTNSYSLDFQFGENPDQLKIMTAHASKGLEFNHVLLGGIYTNDKSFPFNGLLGKLPLSFKWGETISSKQKFKTPQFFLENEINKHKDFSESKRLFYVACTRAENSLGWVNLNFGTIKNRMQSSSWFNGLNIWHGDIFKQSSEIRSKIIANSIDVNIQDKFSLRFLENTSNRPPLFHTNSLGITQKISSSQISILPELSVTRLACIVDCPRKFYLGNVCKIAQSDLTLLASGEGILEESDEENLSQKSFSNSSAQRGSTLHSALEHIIKSDFSHVVDLAERDSHLVNWVVDKLKDFKENYDFISEKGIKFAIYDYMISGIPDLILSPKVGDNIYQVWDFKTGRHSQAKEKPYVFQLMCYAYALYQVHGLDEKKQIKLVLCYLDELKLVEKIVSFDDVDKYLSHYWSKTSTPEEINPDHCQNCLYGNICHK